MLLCLAPCVTARPLLLCLELGRLATSRRGVDLRASDRTSAAGHRTPSPRVLARRRRRRRGGGGQDKNKLRAVARGVVRGLEVLEVLHRAAPAAGVRHQSEPDLVLSMFMVRRDLCGNQNFTARSCCIIVSSSTPSTRRVLDGVAMPVPHRSTEPGRPHHRREMT